MTCEDIREALSASVDGELRCLERAAADSHVASCTSCTEFAAALNRFHVRLAATPRLVAPVTLRSRVVALAGADRAPHAIPLASRRRGWMARMPRLVRIPAPAFVLGAILLLASGGILRSSGMLLPANLRAVVAEHLAHHHAGIESAPVLSIAAAGQRLRDSVSAFAPFQRDPQVEGAFLQGRVARVAEDSAAHFSFTDQDGRPLSLFVMPARCARGDWGSAVRHHGKMYNVASYRGHTIVSWRQKGAFCVMLSPSSDHELLEQARRVQTGFDEAPS